MFFFVVFPEVVPLYCNGPTWGSSRQCVILLSISVLFGEKIRWVGWVLLGFVGMPQRKITSLSSCQASQIKRENL